MVKRSSSEFYPNFDASVNCLLLKHVAEPNLQCRKGIKRTTNSSRKRFLKSERSVGSLTITSCCAPRSSVITDDAAEHRTCTVADGVIAPRDAA